MMCRQDLHGQSTAAARAPTSSPARLREVQKRSSPPACQNNEDGGKLDARGDCKRDRVFTR